MNSIVDLRPEALTATVGPGVINAALRDAAEEEGLTYAPDPTSFEFSTLGGNIATNAGGLCCVKYGVTRDALLEIEMVLPDGQTVRLGRRTRKGVTGYALASLVCGSEGTLGVITEASVSLLPKPGPAHTLVATFASLEAAGGQQFESVVGPGRHSLR
jgi:glycolate oxidase